MQDQMRQAIQFFVTLVGLIMPKYMYHIKFLSLLNIFACLVFGTITSASVTLFVAFHFQVRNVRESVYMATSRHLQRKMVVTSSSVLEERSVYVFGYCHTHRSSAFVYHRGDYCFRNSKLCMNYYQNVSNHKYYLIQVLDTLHIFYNLNFHSLHSLC